MQGNWKLEGGGMVAKLKTNDNLSSDLIILKCNMKTEQCFIIFPFFFLPGAKSGKKNHLGIVTRHQTLNRDEN